MPPPSLATGVKRRTSVDKLLNRVSVLPSQPKQDRGGMGKSQKVVKKKTSFGDAVARFFSGGKKRDDGHDADAGGGAGKHVV